MTEFISRKYGSEGYEIIIKTDNHEHYKSTEDFARRLIDHAKPMTNADRIRAMTDEELAMSMIQISDLDERVGFCKNLYRCELLIDTDDGIPASMCEECMLEWLKQPAEVDNG